MFDLLGMAMAQVQSAIMEQRHFEDSIKELPLDVQHTMRTERLARLERNRLANLKERRHQELCDAIRSTSFWRFGS
jgi:hypothetical protein